MKSTDQDPFRGPGWAIAKFFGAALFGGFISFIVFALIFWINPNALSLLWHILWIIPVVWGILGIFWYDKMLDIARRIVEGIARFIARFPWWFR